MNSFVDIKKELELEKEQSMPARLFSISHIHKILKDNENITIVIVCTFPRAIKREIERTVLRLKREGINIITSDFSSEDFTGNITLRKSNLVRFCSMAGQKEYKKSIGYRYNYELFL